MPEDEERGRLHEAGERAGPEVVEQLTRVVVHELANPLTVVLAALEALQTPDLDRDTARELATRALRQAEHMADLLRDFREGGVRAGALADGRRRQVELVAMIRDAVDTVGPMAAARIVIGVPDDFRMWTVPSRLRQILINLIANASKYATVGPISVDARLADNAVHIDVLDRGPGLPPGDPEELFQLFRQGESAKAGGMGVGLHVVRELAQSLGGTVQLLSREGGGTIARVMLPQRRDRSAAAPAG
ncbi:MAG TPA: HAMP domain-containing sensor histidine kinase [Acidimicrobiales bacterium]|nr:HAMP domain-containing sensor histidine kinase [Acidimicrobiales bacterium]